MIFKLLIVQITCAMPQHQNSPSMKKMRPKRQILPSVQPKLIKVIDFSGDNDGLPDSEGEYTGATMFKETLPTSLTICTSYMVEAWPAQPLARLFTLDEKDGKGSWVNVALNVAQDHIGFNIKLGLVSISATTPHVLFPLHWSHVCLALHSPSGLITLVVDGQVLVEETHPEVLEKYWNYPTHLNLRLGMSGSKRVKEWTGMTTNLNIFSSAMSRERMKRMTDWQECGAPGDYLSWQETEWKLHSAARIEMMDKNELCRAESKVNVYTAEFEYHADCMHHCQKLGSGRSPPIRTFQELNKFQKELHALTHDLSVLPYLWVAATDEKVEKEWRDFYFEEDKLDNYTLPWMPGHDGKFGEEKNCMMWFTDWQDGKFLYEGACKNKNMACACQYARQPILRLRGLCGGHKSLLDNFYTPTQLPSNRALKSRHPGRSKIT